jgi:hypothetical protein
MQTVWMGLGLPALSGTGSGMEGLEGLIPQSAPPLVLPDTPGATLRVTLPVGTRQIWLWTATDRVWYALDEDPGPIPPPVQGGVLPPTIFAAGAILMPGQWQALVMESAMLHALHLVSEAPSPTVYATTYVEAA